MSTFTGSLVIEELEPGRWWRLVQPLRYEAGAKGSGLVIEVPAGFETDGATIPLVLRPFLAVWGTYGRAAALHDFMYSLIRARAWLNPPELNAQPVRAAILMQHTEITDRSARAWADNEFYLAMRACGTRPTLAWLLWAAVRVFGGFHLAQSLQEQTHG